VLLLLKEVTVARPKATLPRQTRRTAATKTKTQTPKRQARKQRSICPVCLQKTAAKKLIIVCTGVESKENSLRACVDCTVVLRRNLVSYALAAAQVGEDSDTEHAVGLLSVLGVSPLGIPYVTSHVDDAAPGACAQPVQLEDTIQLNKISGTGAIPMGQQQYADCPPSCYGLPRPSIEDPVPPQMADAPDQPPVEVKY
jgi:hypothetical protein